MTDDEARRAAFAEAKQRAEVMLDPDAAREAIAAEAVQKTVHRDDGYSSDWAANMPRQEEPAPPVQPRTMTDAEAARWRSYIDGRIEAIAVALAEVKTLATARQAAVGEALGVIRAQLRETIATEIGQLRADLTVEKAHSSSQVIDMPSIASLREARRG